MDLGSHFAAKLEPFLLMGKSVKGAAAAKLIQDATAAPGVFVFSELLELPNIQELGKSEQHGKFLSLLQLFAYRTYQDYVANRDSLPPLNQAQITKLKHLSIVTLATERRILPYPYLLKELEMANVRELEDLIIDAIYLDILRGKLDQKEGQLEIEYTMGRDLEPGRLESVLAALTDWATMTANVLATLDEKIAAISSETAAQKLAQQEHEKALQANLKEVYEKYREKAPMGPRRGPGINPALFSDQRGFGYSGADAPMDVDEPADFTKVKTSRKSPQDAAAKPLRKRNRF
ncbi:hypothetical protein AX16_009368 [Volvariella volvacea WC 439]|nr:hypothetical protein AX16_009368 [Volvariella volvacea WC 439]